MSCRYQTNFARCLKVETQIEIFELSELRIVLKKGLGSENS